MKWYITILLAALIACTNNKRSSGDMVVETTTGSIPDFKSEFMQSQEYIRLLPFGSSREDKNNENDFITVPGDMRHLFYDLTDNQKETCMVRLPDHKGYKVIAVTSVDSIGNPVTQLYTFDTDWKMYDRLQIESIEPLAQYPVVIVQEYSIDKEYKITESKYINDFIIEQLTYEVTEKGTFEELRDGKQEVIAYETFDNNDRLVVESFIWQTSPSGSLTKTNLSQTTYDLKRLR